MIESAQAAGSARSQVHHNELTEKYLAAFQASGLKASEFHAAVQPVTVGTHFDGRCLTRPGLLEREQVRRLEADLETLFRCVTGLPDRLFGGDLGAFALATGVPQQQVDAIVRGRGNAPSRLSRADLYVDDTGFKVLELNMSAALGGIDSGGLIRAMLAQPFLAEFAAEHNLGYVDTMVEVGQTLLAECCASPDARPTVAFCDWPASYPELESQLHKNAAALTKLGMDAFACHLGQLRVDEQFDVWLGERKVDVIYRLFLIEDLLDPTGPALIEPVLRAAERDKVKIFSPMDAELYGSKGALALLSDEANRGVFSDEELDCLDRILPWTRTVRHGPVTVAGRTVLLEEYAIAEREELILKPVMLHGGAGVTPGWQTEPEKWARLLEESMNEQFVLQRRIHPHTELFPSDDGLTEWLLVWGAFLGARGYSGMYLRGGPAESQNAVLNMVSGATGSCCFHELG
ncbi:MAG TPA: hypothetical protein VF557_05570 [Jatrophihabitans sp.]|uniref:hypothetical protein n=1 Tax=Jatrophihabitans sp. TaxID=1932789 RepID=UPI002F1F8D52